MIILDTVKRRRIVDGLAFWGLERGDVSGKYCSLVSTFVWTIVMEIVIPPRGNIREVLNVGG